MEYFSVSFYWHSSHVNSRVRDKKKILKTKGNKTVRKINWKARLRKNKHQNQINQSNKSFFFSIQLVWFFLTKQKCSDVLLYTQLSKLKPKLWLIQRAYLPKSRKKNKTMVNLWFGNNRKKSEKWFSFFSHFLGSFPHVYSITTCNHVAFVAYYTLSLVSSLHLILCGDWKWNHNLDQAHFYHSWFFLFCFGLVSSKISNGWMDREKNFFYVVFIRWCVSSFFISV